MFEKPELKSVEAEGETSSVGDERALEELVAKYTCDSEQKPEWCVYGGGHNGNAGILYWIKPSPEAELMARKMAQLTNFLGGHATAEKTEWNPSLQEEPIYNRLGKSDESMPN